MPRYTVFPGAAMPVGIPELGGTITNYGPDTVYYSSDEEVTVAATSLAVNASVQVYGPTYLYARSRTEVNVVAAVATAGSVASGSSVVVETRSPINAGDTYVSGMITPTSVTQTIDEAVRSDQPLVVSIRETQDGSSWVLRAQATSVFRAGVYSTRAQVSTIYPARVEILNAGGATTTLVDAVRTVSA